MHVLIPGGTGLMGIPLAKSLLESGHQVTILSRNPQNSVVPKGTKVAPWDGISTANWGSLVNEIDAIVNLSGENLAAHRWTPGQMRRILFSRTAPGKALVDACKAADRRPRVLVQASAMGYYGLTGERELGESDPPGEDTLARVCVEWEQASAEVEKLGMRRVVLRTGLVLSKDGGALPRLLLPYRLFVGGPLGSGRQWYAWISIVDQIRAIRFVLENESASGPYNLCSPFPVREADFGRTIARVLHRPHWFPAPAFMLRLLLGEMSTILLNTQRIVPKRLLEAGFRFEYPELEGALEKLL